MLDERDYQRWKELSDKEDEGTLTDGEHQEKLNLEYENEREEVINMIQLGI